MTTPYIDSHENLAAVLGDPIDHSLSPVLHNAGYAALRMTSWHYHRIRCTAESLPEIVGNAPLAYRGFSVTMPAKFAALAFADEVTDRARVIGAANTLVRTIDGWRADNTDCEGLSVALSELTGGTTLDRAVLIGAGGTSRPALWALAERGVREVDLINRSDRRAELADLCDHLGLVLNYHPLDTDDRDLRRAILGADVMVSTVPAAGLTGREATLAHCRIVDVIYDPWPTPLAMRAAANGYRAVGGRVMLAGQAFAQFEQFTGAAAPRQHMRDALDKHVRG